MPNELTWISDNMSRIFCYLLLCAVLGDRGLDSDAVYEGGTPRRKQSVAAHHRCPSTIVEIWYSFETG